MSSPNTNFIANKNIRRRSTYQFIKECNDLSISSSSSGQSFSPDFFASVYHQLHTIDNAHELGSLSTNNRCPVSQQPSTSKVTSSLDGSNSDVAAVDSSMSLTNKIGGAKLSPFESNASETVDHPDCHDSQFELTQHRSKSDVQRNKILLCPRRNHKDHICAIQPGGLEESEDVGFDACDQPIIEANSVIQLSDVSLIHLHYHHTTPLSTITQHNARFFQFLIRTMIFLPMTKNRTLVVTMIAIVFNC